MPYNNINKFKRLNILRIYRASCGVIIFIGGVKYFSKINFIK